MLAPAEFRVKNRDAAPARRGTARRATAIPRRWDWSSSASARRRSPAFWPCLPRAAGFSGNSRGCVPAAAGGSTTRSAPHATSAFPDGTCPPRCCRSGRFPAADCRPALWMAVRYCERTMRRSSSNQRGSLLPERSIAPPVSQKWFQFFCAASFVCANVGRFFASKSLLARRRRPIPACPNRPSVNDELMFGRVRDDSLPCSTLPPRNRHRCPVCD